MESTESRKEDIRLESLKMALSLTDKLVLKTGVELGGEEDSESFIKAIQTVEVAEIFEDYIITGKSEILEKIREDEKNERGEEE